MVVLGPRAGQRLLRLGRHEDHDEKDGVEQQRTVGHGFNLHAALRVSAGDLKGRERLLRYILRPPIATKRFTREKDGRVIYWLREPWADGSQCVSFEPLDFIAKLLPLVPPPRVNLVRYHGLFAPHSKLRAQVVPHVDNTRDGGGPGQLALPLGPGNAKADGAGKPDAPGDYRCGGQKQSRARPDAISWPDLAARTFHVDVLRCERCGFSPIRVIAVVVAPTRDQLAAFSANTPLQAAATRSQRSRAPPTGQTQFAFARAAA